MNGIRDHHDEIRHLLANSGFHVLAINETHVDNDVPDQVIDIDGYRIEHRDTTSTEGWGSRISQRSPQLCC